MHVCAASLFYKLDLPAQSIFIFAGYEFEVRFELSEYESSLGTKLLDTIRH